MDNMVWWGSLTQQLADVTEADKYDSVDDAEEDELLQDLAEHPYDAMTPILMIKFSIVYVIIYIYMCAYFRLHAIHVCLHDDAYHISV